MEGYDFLQPPDVIQLKYFAAAFLGTLVQIACNCVLPENILHVLCLIRVSFCERLQTTTNNSCVTHTLWGITVEQCAYLFTKAQ